MVKAQTSGSDNLSKEHGSVRRPDVFIVGAPKCGTTAMDKYLASHPDIFMGKKEMNVFGQDLHFGRQFYRRDLSEYLNEFNGRNGQGHAGEASVWYLFSTRAAEEIKAFNPEARIIIMLREPSEMIHSLYHQFRFDGNEHLSTFEEALAAEEARRAGRKFGRQTYFAQGLQYRDTARYAEQVRRYFEVFGRSRVHVILYEDFAADVGACYRAALEFLGVDSEQGERNFEIVNGNKTVKNPAIRALLGDRWIRSAAVSIARKLPRPIFDFMHDLERRVWKMNARPMKRAPLDPELGAALRREFAPEVECLGALLGRDLSHWHLPALRRGDSVLIRPALAQPKPEAIPCVVAK